MKIIAGLLLIVIGIALCMWLCLWVMLYGGIMHALENWEVNNSAVAWGIIRAICCGLGVIPGYILFAVALALIDSD